MTLWQFGLAMFLALAVSHLVVFLERRPCAGCSARQEETKHLREFLDRAKYINREVVAPEPGIKIDSPLPPLRTVAHNEPTAGPFGPGMPPFGRSTVWYEDPVAEEEPVQN